MDELKIAGNAFSSYFYPNYAKIHSLNEKEFVTKIDSARKVFVSTVNKYAEQLEKDFVNSQRSEIKYYFDRILLDYAYNHDTYLQSEKQTTISKELSKRLQDNLSDFNKPELLSNSDFLEYVRAYFHQAVNTELASGSFKNTDNQTLHAVWKLIPPVFSNNTCKEFWQTVYLSEQIENNGIKNIEQVMNDFRKSCKNQLSVRKINSMYAEDSVARQSHITKVYKSVDGINLDLHIFLPDSSQYSKKRPVFVYFHGGSWTEGKPDWGFSSCENYARKGWVGVAVEYRTAGRHNTLPFESVMDARSSIRWLRKNAALYSIDTASIVATGNSAGGHLVLTTALASRWNEKTDDLKYSPTPNILLVNSGVYDLTIGNSQWITRNLKDKEMVNQISPNHLEKKNMPPLLVIHGTKDGSCPYWTAEKFRDDMAKTSNAFEFHHLEGAGHAIWFDQRFTEQISKWRIDFLLKFGFQ
jgi:acetyl esterase/lipase